MVWWQSTIINYGMNVWLQSLENETSRNKNYDDENEEQAMNSDNKQQNWCKIPHSINWQKQWEQCW